MKSKNNLSITGVIVGDITTTPKRTVFSIVHNYGGPIPPLYLRCVIPCNATIVTNHLVKGTQVHIDAFLRPAGDRVEAFVKRITLN